MLTAALLYVVVGLLVQLAGACYVDDFRTRIGGSARRVFLVMACCSLIWPVPVAWDIADRVQRAIDGGTRAP